MQDREIDSPWLLAASRGVSAAVDGLDGEPVLAPLRGCPSDSLMSTIARTRHAGRAGRPDPAPAATSHMDPLRRCVADTHRHPVRRPADGCGRYSRDRSMPCARAIKGSAHARTFRVASRLNRLRRCHRRKVHHFIALSVTVVQDGRAVDAVAAVALVARSPCPGCLPSPAPRARSRNTLSAAPSRRPRNGLGRDTGLGAGMRGVRGVVRGLEVGPPSTGSGSG